MKNFHRFLEQSALPLLVIVLVPVAVVLYLVFMANSNQPAPASSTNSAPTSVANTPQPSATIFLDDASELPQTVPASQFIPFSFTIQNIGNASGAIPYRVSVKWSTGEDDVIDENIAQLAGGASTTIDEQLKFEIATETAEVILELPQTGQSAQFALPRTQ